VVVLFILGVLVQISWQALGASFATYEPTDCKAGVRSLAVAIDAARQTSEGTEATPEEALVRFRGALSPSWGQRDRIEAACRKQSDPALLEAFDTIERLRYAEENAVRRGAHDLAPLRRAERTLLSGPLADRAP
jgi:hypothetical protein